VCSSDLDQTKRSVLGKNSLLKVESQFSQKTQINKIISQLIDGAQL
jgi:hypothetical protein